MDNNNKADKPVDFSYPEGLWEAAEFCFPCLKKPRKRKPLKKTAPPLERHNLSSYLIGVNTSLERI